MNRYIAIAGILLGALAVRAQTVETVVQGLNEPYGIGVDLERNTYYFTSSATDRLYSYTPGQGAALQVVAIYPSSDGRIGVPDANPQGVAVSRAGVAVALSGLHEIERRTFGGAVVRIGDGVIGNDNGPASTASFNFPYAVAMDNAGNIFVADSQNDSIRLINPANEVSTFATGISQPTAIALSPDEQQIAVAAADRILVLNRAGGVVATSSTGFAANRGLLWVGGDTGLLGTHYQDHGIGQVGYGNVFAPNAAVFAGGISGQRDGDLNQALFNEPAGLARDLDGSILVADLKNGAIRAIKRPLVSAQDFNEPPGIYTDEVQLTLKNEIVPSNSQYRFTLDKKDPTVYSQLYTSGMTLAARGTNTSATIKLRGFSPDANSSLILSNLYQYAVAPLTLLDGEQPTSGGALVNDAQLTALSGTPGVTFRYTLDGAIPTAASPVWTNGAFGRTSSLILRGFRDGFEPSPILSNKFRFDVSAPVIQPAGGIFTNDVLVVVTNETRAVTHRHTLNNTAPTPGSEATLTNGAPLLFAGNAPGQTNLVMRVGGFKDGYISSPESSATFSFLVAPLAISRAGGSYNNPTNVTVRTATEGAVIRYKVYPHGTDDLAPPTEADPVWVSGSYGQDGILVAAATRPGYAPSTLLVQPFTFSVAPLSISLAGGAFNNATNLSINTITAGATVRYKIYPHGSVDITAPTESDAIWTNGVHAQDGILVARAFRPGFAPSPVLTQTFNFRVAPLVININGGVFNNATNLAVTTATAGAVVRYKISPAGTLSPAAPTESDPVWTDGLYSTNGILALRAFRAGFEPSPVITPAFTFIVGEMSLNVRGGAFNNSTNLSLRTVTEDAVIRFKVYPHNALDTPAPTEADAVWTDGAYAQDGILVARAFRPGFIPSAPLSQAFNFRIAPLEISVNGGTFNNPTDVFVSSATASAVIRYKVYPHGTRNPAPPVESDPVWQDGSYSTNGILALKAFRSGFEASPAIMPVFTFVVGDIAASLPGGAFNNGASLTLRTVTDTAVIRYKVYPHNTQDIEPPTEADASWTNGVHAQDGILVARAFRPGFLPSALLTQTYNFRIAPLEISVDGGTFNNATNVFVSTATTGATIRFRVHPHGTRNPAPPAETDAVWLDGAFAGNGIVTIRGFRAGFESSPVISPVFNFVVAPVTASLAAGTFNNSTNLNLRTLTEAAEIRYKIYPHGTENLTPPTDADPIWVDGVHAQDGIFVAKAFRAGFTPSDVFTRPYNFVVAPLVMNPPGGNFINQTNVSIRTATTGATLRYKIYPHFTEDPAPPTESDLVWTDGVHAQDGLLMVRGFRTGFASSPVITQSFNFRVGDIALSVPSGSFNNAISVSAGNGTTNTSFRYTLDGSEPTATSAELTNPLTVNANSASGTNVTLKVAGFRNGFARSGNTAQATYSFSVDAPVIRPKAVSPDGVYIDSVTLEVVNSTQGARHTYTLDGSNPTGASPVFPAELTLTKMQPLKVLGLKDNYNNSPIVTENFQIKVPRPSLSSMSGFFPSGTMVTAVVTRADAYLAYSVNGADPTAADVRGARTNRLVINVDSLEFPSPDLRFLKVRAFADDLVPSDVVGGELMGENMITVPTDAIAGSGANVVIPIVLNLRSNQTLRSVQFAVEVAPAQAGTPNIERLRPLVANTNDFVQVRDGHISTTPYQVQIPLESTIEAADGRVTNVMRWALLDTLNFGLRDYGMVGMVAVKLPAAATNGSAYTIRITNASGTEDGNQRSVALTPGAPRTITVGTRPYLVGDTAPGVWYNAGDFGDGIIDNADVLNAFRASLDLRKPFWFVSPGDVTDAFNAMDAFPEDSPTKAGGLDQPTMRITMNDWQLLLERSTSGEKGWYRYWTNNGQRLPLRADSVGDISGFSFAGGDPLTTPPGAVWVSDALIHAGIVEHAQPGQSVAVPVRVRVLPGQDVTGLQFRAMVAPVSGAPDLTGGVTFTAAEGLPAFRSLDGLPANNVVAAWDIGSINPAIQGTKLLGHIRFTIPASAARGDCYRVRFAGVGGAPELRTEYMVESTGACVVVQDANHEPVDRISDEWRTAFFGRLDDFRAHAEADPDEDGVPNWKEFLAGTHPLQRSSRLALLAPERRGAGFALKFLSAPGKRYVIESSESLGAEWALVQTGIIGDGSFLEFVDSKPVSEGRFYRIRLEDAPE